MPQIPPELVCCFTGHRPEKLPWRYNEEDPRCGALKDRLPGPVHAVYRAGLRPVICGMAKGCDTFFAETVLELRNEAPGVTLEAAIPCESQFLHWSREERRRYDYIMHQCDLETILQREYTKDCMAKRNQYMVDCSSLLIAVYDGSYGGTMQTVNYAKKRGLMIIQLEP